MTDKLIQNLKKAVAGASILITGVVGGFVADQTPTIKVGGLEMTEAQYGDFKSALVWTIDHRKEIPVTTVDVDIWKNTVNYQLAQCDGPQLLDVTEENMVDKLNEGLAKGFCKVEKNK